MLSCCLRFLFFVRWPNRVMEKEWGVGGLMEELNAYIRTKCRRIDLQGEDNRLHKPHGIQWSKLWTRNLPPTPRFAFLGFESSWNARLRANTSIAGPCSTPAKIELNILMSIIQKGSLLVTLNWIPKDTNYFVKFKNSRCHPAYRTVNTG